MVLKKITEQWYGMRKGWMTLTGSSVFFFSFVNEYSCTYLQLSDDFFIWQISFLLNVHIFIILYCTIIPIKL